MNRFKFDECVDCAHVGRGVQNKTCGDCRYGENFEQRVKELGEIYEEQEARDH